MKDLIIIVFLTLFCSQAGMGQIPGTGKMKRNPVSWSARSDKINRVSELQLQCFEAAQLISRGINGRKIRIAVIDAGFSGADSHPGLKHLFDNKQIIATWDFIRQKENVYHGHPHGTAVLSCIAGILDGRQLGLATGAEFLLARTEDRRESGREERNFARAVDWAVENGAQIIQSSLGYTHQRYFIEDMDGKTSLAVQAVRRATSKGVLFINSNGNEGSGKWKYMGTPADADSMLSIGAIDPETGMTAGFSSYGPTADRRLKPNLTAPGTAAVFSPVDVYIKSGTSFSAPLVTGFAACAWQLHPEANAQEIISMVEHSGDLYPYYDYAMGYGVPKASRLLGNGYVDNSVPVRIEETGTHFIVNILDYNPVNHNTHGKPYLFYHISRPDGVLRRYGAYLICGFDPVIISKSDFQQGDLLRIHYRGRTVEWKEKN
jgi:subtilisin family serine protease